MNPLLALIVLLRCSNYGANIGSQQVCLLLLQSRRPSRSRLSIQIQPRLPAELAELGAGTALLLLARGA